MKSYQYDLLKTCIQQNILEFGEFKLKSGRLSPYFFNAGLFNNGQLLNQIASSYASLIHENIKQEFMLYGPAYKGIPLAASTACKLVDNYDINIEYAFNRKEEKDHGEGGSIIGASLKGNVVVIDDVITAGTSVSESIDTIHAHGAKLHAIVVALDRQEKIDDEGLSSIQKIEKEYNVAVYPLIKLDDLIEYMQAIPGYQSDIIKIEQYRKQYGIGRVD